MPTYAEEFSRKVTKQAIARTSLALGYKEAQTEVVDSLADIIRYYIEKLSSSSLEIAEGHGRAQPGIHDVIKALESMQSTHTRDWTELAQFAFPPEVIGGTALLGGDDGRDGDTENEEEKDLGASSSSGTTGSKGDNKAAWRQPFPHLVPKYPVKQKAKIDSSRLLSEDGDGANARPAFVPGNLPPFPPAHTYKKDKATKSDSGKRSSTSSAGGGRAKKLKS